MLVLYLSKHHKKSTLCPRETSFWQLPSFDKWHHTYQVLKQKFSTHGLYSTSSCQFEMQSWLPLTAVYVCCTDPERTISWRVCLGDWHLLQLIHHHQLTSISWPSKTKVLLQWYWSFLITTNSLDSADQKTQILNSKYQTKGPGNLWGTLEHSSETWQAKPPPSALLSALSSKSSLNSEAPDSVPNRKLPNPFVIIPRTMPSGLPSKAPLLVQFQPSLLFMLFSTLVLWAKETWRRKGLLHITTLWSQSITKEIRAGAQVGNATCWLVFSMSH